MVGMMYGCCSVRVTAVFSTRFDDWLTLSCKSGHIFENKITENSYLIRGMRNPVQEVNR